MRNIATGQSSHRNNRNRTTRRELHRLLVNLRQIGINRTRHRVFWRNLVHTVRYNCQRIGVAGHISQQHQHLLIIIYCKIFSSSQRHIRNQQTFHRRILGRIHETHNTVKSTSIGEHILKVQVVVIRHTHTAQNNLICFSTQCHICHYLVERLVGVSKKWNLLTGHQRIIQVDTGNTCRNQFRRLFAPNRIHWRTTDFHFLSFNLGTTVNRVTKSIEETSCQLLTNL